MSAVASFCSWFSARQKSADLSEAVTQGFRMMAAEGTYKAYFRGNGANVIKNVPETALKLTCNDRVKALIAQDGHIVSFGESWKYKCAMLTSHCWSKAGACFRYCVSGQKHMTESADFNSDLDVH